MGQRHQIYIAIRDRSNRNGDMPTVVTGIHHQWLFGRIAAKQVNRLMMLLTKDNNLKRFPAQVIANKNQAGEVLMSVYTSIPEDGYFTNDICRLSDEETTNPLKGDNNDGITIIDFTDTENPTYCMMALPTSGDFLRKGAKEYVPYTSAQYVNLYYPDTENATWKTGATPKKIKATLAECHSIEKTGKKFKLMTCLRVVELFPKAPLYKV